MTHAFGDLEALLRDLFGPVQVDHTKAAAWKHQAQWRASFASGVEDIGRRFSFEWEMFSARVAPCSSEGEAIAIFEAVQPIKLLCCVQLGVSPLYLVDVRQRPGYRRLRNAWDGDLYLSDGELAWTFVLTHEQALGPYFAEARDDARGGDAD